MSSSGPPGSVAATSAGWARSRQPPNAQRAYNAGSRFSGTAEEKRYQSSSVQPCEPIAPSHVKRTVVPDGRRCDERRKGHRRCILLGQDTPAVVTDGQHTLLGSAYDREAAFHASQHSHPAVQPAVEGKVPGRHEQQSHSSGAILAAQGRKVHILANLHSPDAGRLIKHRDRCPRLIRVLK